MKRESNFYPRFSFFFCGTVKEKGKIMRKKCDPEPLATQTHEPKMKVTPLGGVMVLKAKVAIELAESPTWRASCRCLPPSLLKDTLSSRVCR